MRVTEAELPARSVALAVAVKVPTPLALPPVTDTVQAGVTDTGAARLVGGGAARGRHRPEGVRAAVGRAREADRGSRLVDDRRTTRVADHAGRRVRVEGIAVDEVEGHRVAREGGVGREVHPGAGLELEVAVRVGARRCDHVDIGGGLARRQRDREPDDAERERPADREGG